MRRKAFVAVALGLATAWTTPTVLAQNSTASQNETPHQSASGQSDSIRSHTSQGNSQSSLDQKDLKSVRASKLLGINVTSKEGESLGQVQDFVLDPKTGKIRFALVGQGFMAGLGEKLIPIPWKAIDVHAEKQFALNVDKQKMQSAPNWTQSDLEQPDYVIRIYRFYQLEPMEDVGGSGSSASESGQQHGSSSGRPQSNSDSTSSKNADQK